MNICIDKSYLALHSNFNSALSQKKTTLFTVYCFYCNIGLQTAIACDRFIFLLKSLPGPIKYTRLPAFPQAYSTYLRYAVTRYFHSQHYKRYVPYLTIKPKPKPVPNTNTARNLLPSRNKPRNK